MQIAILGRDIRPPWNEAVKNMACELAKQLCSHGHQVHLISNGTKQIESVPNLQVHEIPRSNFSQAAVDTVEKLKASHNIDLVHIQNLIIHRSLAGLVKSLKKSTKLPIVSYCCQLPALPVTHWLRVLRKDPREAFTSKLGMLAPAFLARSSINNVDMVISSSRYIQQHLQKNDDDQTKVIHPFVNAEHIRHRLSESEHQTTTQPRLLYLGSHKILRGEDDFLQMLARLRSTLPNVHGTLVTTFPIPHRTRRLVNKLGITDSVEFLPRGVELDVPLLIQASSLYVFTGLPPVGSIDPPLTLIEALIIGTPIISYDAGGINEIVDPANLVKYGDVDSLTEAASTQLTNRITRKPRPDLLEEFSSENAVLRFLGLYERVT